MSKIIVPIEMPEACAYCRFRTTSEYIQVGDGLYKRISCCQFAPDWLEDPYRDICWEGWNSDDLFVRVCWHYNDNYININVVKDLIKVTW